MSILYSIIFVLFTVYASRHFKKCVLMYAPMKILFHGYIYLIDSSFFITFDAAITIMLLFFYLKNKKTIVPFPLKVPYLIYGLSCVIYAIYPSVSVGQFQTICSELAFTFIFYQVLLTTNDLSFTIKYFIIIGYVLMINGLIDVVTHFNPIEEIMKASSGTRYWTSDNNVMRYNFARTKSFLPHAIGMGTVCAILLYLMTFIYLNDINVKRNNIIFILIVLLLGGVILSNSRTPLIILGVGMIAFLGKQLFKGYRWIGVFVLGIAFLVLVGGYLQHMVDTVLHSDKVATAGSSSEMREKQLAIALNYYSKSPIFGMGDKFVITKLENEHDTWGMESIWLQLIYQRGLIGVAGSLFLYLGLFWVLRGGKFYKHIFFFILMWLIACTLTSLPGINNGYFLCIIILIYKVSSNKLNNITLFIYDKPYEQSNA